VGKYITEALVKTGKHTVTALTREDSTNKLPEGVTTIAVNYDDDDSLVEALRGQQVLIITIAYTAPPETHSKLVRAAAEAGVPYVMPNGWGTDTMNEKLQEDTMYGTRLSEWPHHIFPCSS
jgi:saccharopine dehydrogenase-like NADP-dependent oxidoreductase